MYGRGGDCDALPSPHWSDFPKAPDDPVGARLSDPTSALHSDAHRPRSRRVSLLFPRTLTPPQPTASLSPPPPPLIPCPPTASLPSLSPRLFLCAFFSRRSHPEPVFGFFLAVFVGNLGLDLGLFDAAVLWDGRLFVRLSGCLANLAHGVLLPPRQPRLSLRLAGKRLDVAHPGKILARQGTRQRVRSRRKRRQRSQRRGRKAARVGRVCRTSHGQAPPKPRGTAFAARTLGRTPRNRRKRKTTSATPTQPRSRRRAGQTRRLCGRRRPRRRRAAERKPSGRRRNRPKAGARDAQDARQQKSTQRSRQRTRQRNGRVVQRRALLGDTLANPRVRTGAEGARHAQPRPRPARAPSERGRRPPQRRRTRIQTASASAHDANRPHESRPRRANAQSGGMRRAMDPDRRRGAGANATDRRHCSASASSHESSVARMDRPAARRSDDRTKRTPIELARRSLPRRAGRRGPIPAREGKRGRAGKVGKRTSGERGGGEEGDRAPARAPCAAGAPQGCRGARIPPARGRACGSFFSTKRQALSPQRVLQTTLGHRALFFFVVRRHAAGRAPGARASVGGALHQASPGRPAEPIAGGRRGPTRGVEPSASGRPSIARAPAAAACAAQRTHLRRRPLQVRVQVEGGVGGLS